MHIAFLDGRPASADDLRALALVNYGHFTSIQVRGRAARGFDLHLRRLRDATRELFDAPLDGARVRGAILAALDGNGVADASVRVTVFSRDFDYAHPDRAQVVDVLVSLSPPRDVGDRAAWVKTMPFQRPLPHIKHVGTFPLFQARRHAKRSGFDDALFVDAKGCISEGSIWNIGFWDGEQVVWPRADALRGTTEKLLQAGLAEAGIGQRHEPVEARRLGAYRAAFATNSSGVWPLSGIDEVALRPDAHLMAGLATALECHPWQSLAG
jgi:branched-subunit amino acid aminotransferase/4-amino-4-deoxychorismate lyase